ncbi:DUF1275 domain-containing protein [Altererythrobacter indicus]|uniref:DUF1275 domain-containing protein n=1 Tax=Altericroceibacterium indicum TaxID=374177 RepID=A0A845AD77_9SPHN|nr:YoaK family protein [Altericroceibacterium indicum]MXP26496.1 DUF1275 domain-containing protein [Altericroceibacterium indicum]
MQRLSPSQRRLAIGLAGLAGFVDGVGFLSANGYFVSFMSGNTTRLAVDLVTDTHMARIPALLIGGFVLGVLAGGVVALKSGMQQTRNVLILVTALLLGGALAYAFGSVVLSVGCMVLAMGALNNSFQRDGGSPFGLTYMTGALVRFGQGLAYWLCGKDVPGFGGLLALWFGLSSGAVAGALAYGQFGGWAVALAGALSCIAVLATIYIGPDPTIHHDGE